MNWKGAFLLVGFMLLTGMYTSTAEAQFNLCIIDPAFGQQWEVKVILPGPGGVDFQIEMARTTLSPLPASGGWRTDPSIWYFNWNASFAGATQGTVHYSCEINRAGALPWTGDGMILRHSSFGGANEIITGTCTLDLCSSPATMEPGVDRATQL